MLWCIHNACCRPMMPTDVVGACASLLAACASLWLDLVVPVQSYGLLFHWARIPWCLDRIHSAASEPSGSRGRIGHGPSDIHVGSPSMLHGHNTVNSYLRSSGDWTGVATRKREAVVSR